MSQLASLYGLRDKMPIGEKEPDGIVKRCSEFSERCIIEQAEWIPYFGIKNNDIFFTTSSCKKWMFLQAALWAESLQYDYFLFLTSNMSDHERKGILKDSAFKILRMYFLDWLLQWKFLNAAEQLLPYFTERDFRDMLRLIIYERIMLGRKDFNYIDLLKEFCGLSAHQI
ncbi:uncharacterized protein TNIN_493131 [Trichonephila inaurata madagascariensis]|uniref:Uncharacterized protein n=1 Tax=Trichonephila inaurata madagascariensis TaxID=2747483 RepID=A0A8X6Y8U9_9ARAC|nr:uncharacterized protein TNIN_493131 [Trichonephila inaurata madagascariensis]